MQSMPSYYPTNYQNTPGYATSPTTAATATPSQTSPSVGDSVMNGTSVLAVSNAATPHLVTSAVPRLRTDAPKRNQVKNACTNCQKACKKCDDARPCPRCQKYGIAETCVNSVRKERKKGIKRGPYKRRQKTGDDKLKEKQLYDTVAAAALAVATGTEGTTPPTAMGTPTTSNTPVESLSHPTTPHPVAATTATTVNPAVPDFGYPTQLSQYTQGYDTYNYGVNAVYNNSPVTNNANNNNKDHSTILSAQYVLNPVYPSYTAPVLINNEADTPASHDENNTDGINSNENAPASPETRYRQALQGILSSQLEAKDEDEKQSMTPVNASGTKSPSNENANNENKSGLNQLCSAALSADKPKEETAEVDAAQIKAEVV
ncbi:putative transcriptional regulatory protein C27B12.11c [Choanephora cucurbitarum]|uniref:Putative transcriptional regulatory protein C27B12.11c n=1 Tax=Choanephora cucurbitarum TaxID=101091 RepID=A0A1C7NH37_9FUNG|nr:putative transcriptional regulatory protein C27B12.11c [Choanephora cucurbitarum]